MHSPAYQESCFLHLAFSPLGHLSGHAAHVWPALCGSMAFPAQTQMMVQEALGWGVCFLPPALATCCQARAVGCFSSSSVVRGDPPHHHRCAVHVTRSSTWKGASPTPQHVSAHAAGFLSKAVPVFLEGSDLWHLRSRLTPS